MQLLVVFILILINGLFAMAEMALVSARRTKLKQLAAQGNEQAKSALALSGDPDNFLSTAQIGVTLIGILIGAFGEGSFSHLVSARLQTVSFLKPVSDKLGFVIAITIITYVSLVVGEIVPKRLAMHAPERLALYLSPFMAMVARVTHPAVIVLTASSNAILRAMQVKPASNRSLSEDEIRVLINESTRAGVFEKVEEDIAQRALRLADQQIKTIMTPRSEIIWLNTRASDSLSVLKSTPHSHLPVCNGSLDKLIGVAHAKNLLKICLRGEKIDLRQHIDKPYLIPENTRVVKVLEIFKKHNLSIACVVDEYGSVQGIVSFKDIMQTIIGDISEATALQDPHVFKTGRDYWLVDGMLAIDKLKKFLNMPSLPNEKDGNFQTLNGFILTYLDRIPSPGEEFSWNQYRFRIIAMIENRIDKVEITKIRKNPMLLSKWKFRTAQTNASGG